MPIIYFYHSKITWSGSNKIKLWKRKIVGLPGTREDLCWILHVFMDLGLDCIKIHMAHFAHTQVLGLIIWEKCGGKFKIVIGKTKRKNHKYYSCCWINSTVYNNVLWQCNFKRSQYVIFLCFPFKNCGSEMGEPMSQVCSRHMALLHFTRSKILSLARNELNWDPLP